MEQLGHPALPDTAAGAAKTSWNWRQVGLLLLAVIAAQAVYWLILDQHLFHSPRAETPPMVEQTATAIARLRDVAHAMGVNVAGLDAEAGAQACLAAIRQLALDVGIPKCLADLGVKEADIPLLATNALKDACGLTNPRTATQADIEGIFRGAMTA